MVLDYSLFGLKHKGYNDIVSANTNSIANKFKYNGKELEESLNLNLYEMDLRQYDPAIGRWTGIDPVTHWEYSTYSSFDNNPVFFADPSGADSTDPVMRAKENKPEWDNTISSNAGGGPGDDDCCGGSGTESDPYKLEEVVINFSNSRASDYGAESDFAMDIKSYNGLFGFSGNYEEVFRHYRNVYGNSYVPLDERPWTIDATGFADAFDAGWNGWDKNGTANFWMNFSSATIGGSLTMPLLSAGAPAGFGGLGDKALTFAARTYLNYQVSTGTVAGGSGTTILLGRYMDKVINPMARQNGYTTITNSLPSMRSLTMPYNKAWLQYHYNSGSNILMHINSNSGNYSPYMQMEIRLLMQLYSK